MEIPKQEYWSRLPFPPSGDLPDPGLKPTSPTLVGHFFLPLHQLGSPQSYNSVQFSYSVISDSLKPHELQQARLPCPSPTPRASSNTSLMLMMPSNYLILCHPLLLLPSVFPSIRVYSNESVLHFNWPKYWSFNFSISPSNEYLGLTDLIN